MLEMQAFGSYKPASQELLSLLECSVWGENLNRGVRQMNYSE